jgi:hypothetical protein
LKQTILAVTCTVLLRHVTEIDSVHSTFSLWLQRVLSTGFFGDETLA